jgi:AcrR family transcriptional regulator
MAKRNVRARVARSNRRGKGGKEPAGREHAVRNRILGAAFAAFRKNGYAASSTLEIATRARVSKRELYALVGNKQEMLVECIRERAARFRAPAGMLAVRDRKTLARVLGAYGARLVREVSDPTVIAMFRLAIGEARNAPEVARALDSIGREAGRAALREIMARARAARVLKGNPTVLAEQFRGLLWGDLMVSLLLGVAKRPSERAIAGRAREATSAFLKIHPNL